MKKTMFETLMKAKAAHSTALQKLGFTKWQIRDHSPIHHLLTYITFRMALNLDSPT